MSDPKEKLKNFKPKFDHFIGIDSDGCAFPTMDIKQKQCFHPQIMDEWNLWSIEKELRMVAEWVNLYSKFRGINRFPALQKTFDYLREMSEVQAKAVEIPETDNIKKFIDSGLPLGNASLTEWVKDHPEVARWLKWSLAVNENVARIVKDVAPFKFVRESLEKINGKSDVIVVSATPLEALEREWQEHDLAKYVEIIAGQEQGSKKEHLEMCTKGNYEKNHVLMIGDAPGDLKAARANGALFFPVNPGHEEESWELFLNEGLDKFLNDNYAGDYEKKLIEEFDALLPAEPHWKK